MISQVLTVVDSDQPDTIINRLKPIAEIAPMYDQRVVITPGYGVPGMPGYDPTPHKLKC